jgi:hypothetical protein
VSAEILRLNDYRVDESVDSEIDLATAVDVAIRDLREILMCWGSDKARQRAQECKSTLQRAYSGFINFETVPQKHSDKGLIPSAPSNTTSPSKIRDIHPVRGDGKFTRPGRASRCDNPNFF